MRKIPAFAKPAVDRIRRQWQWYRWGPRAIVLAYHRIAEVTPDPLGLCVTPGHFREHLEVLRGYEPVRLDGLIATLERRSSVPERVCITFDDGYADNLHIAKPLLQRFDVPATVFVTSGQASLKREFWWDEIGRLLHSRPLPAAPVPPELIMLGDEATMRAADGQILFEAVHRRLSDLAAAERACLLERLRSWMGEAAEVRPSHALLSPEEVLQLAEGGLVEIGAHTITHPLLDRLEEAEQRAEIELGKRQLEDVVNRPVSSFAYPHGRYTSRMAALVAEAGFARACTVDVGVVWRRTDRWQIPRLLVKGMDGDALARTLSRWFRRAPRPARYA